MSLYDKKMPSLKDKIREQAEVPKEPEVEVESEVVEPKIRKGRRLNK